MRLLRNLKEKILSILSELFAPKVKAEITVMSPNQLLKGRTALITGGSSGIGFEIAKAFINAGASVIITGRDLAKLNIACEQLNNQFSQNVQCFILQMDNECPEIFEKQIVEKLNSIKQKMDILVNNAGVLGGHLSDATIQEYDKVLNINLRAVFFLSQFAGKYMKENHIQGNILNIASSSSLRPAASAYTVSKWGIRGLTLGMARVLAPFGIIVNGLAPGPTFTPMLGKTQRENIYMKHNPLGRYALPEEIANMAVILVSNMAKTIVGDIVYMTGGAGIVYNEDMDWTF